MIGGFIRLLVVLYVIRLFGLQLGDHTYRENADSNAFFKKVLYPMRGLIYDRNGRLVVYNQPAYDLMVTPREAVDFDTLQLCKILGMSRADFDALWAEMKDTRKNPGYSSYTQQKLLSQLIANGQVATQYVDLACQPTMDMSYNPNGAVLAIEGITSPDGRVFGKMGHSERSGELLYKNVTGDKYQPLFEGGVNYFKL